MTKKTNTKCHPRLDKKTNTKCHPRLDKKTNTKHHLRLDKKTNTKRHPRLDKKTNTKCHPRLDRGSNVHITTVAPFYIRTGMFEGVKSWLIPILPPEYVCKRVIRAIERNTIFRGIPFSSHFIRFWQTVLPVRIFDFIFGKVVGLYHALDNFTGRK